MKLAIIVSQLLVAAAVAKDCTDVSVVGDGTFCIKGPVCAGKDFYDGNENCPQIGDTAVDACRPSNPSYNKATGKCVAPVPADCLLLPTGAYGCVWNLSKVPEPTNPPAPPANCEKVSVVGDGTFCIAGPICSGKDDFDDKEKCPQVGDAAVDACRPSNPSYNKAMGKCVAPVPAECRLLPTGAYGCVWDLTKLPPSNSTVPTPAPTTKAPTPAPSVPAPTTKAPTPAPTTPAPTTKGPTSAPTTPAPTTTKPNNNQTQPTVVPGCTNVTVVGDAKFCIMGPICEGRVFDDGKENCPKAGDYAVDNCFSTSPSYEPKSEYCRAPVDAQCLLQDSGEYKCAWPSAATKAVTFNAAVSGASAAGASTGIAVGAVAASRLSVSLSWARSCTKSTRRRRPSLSPRSRSTCRRARPSSARSETPRRPEALSMRQGSPLGRTLDEPSTRLNIPCFHLFPWNTT